MNDMSYGYNNFAGDVNNLRREAEQTTNDFARKARDVSSEIERIKRDFEAKIKDIELIQTNLVNDIQSKQRLFNDTLDRKIEEIKKAEALAKKEDAEKSKKQ